MPLSIVYIVCRVIGIGVGVGVVIGVARGFGRRVEAMLMTMVVRAREREGVFGELITGIVAAIDFTGVGGAGSLAPRSQKILSREASSRKR